MADFRDPWPATSQDLRPYTPLSRSLNGRLESAVLRHADVVISTTDSTSAYFKSIRTTNHKYKCETITNGFDEDDFRLLLSFGTSKLQMSHRSRRYALPITGDPEPFFAALRTLVEAGKIDDKSVEVDLIGDCSSFRGVSISKFLERYGLTNWFGL